MDELISDNNLYCLAKKNEIYHVYLHPGRKTTELYLGDSDKEFAISEFDQRNEKLYNHGSVPSVVAKGSVRLANPPKDSDKDWAVLIKVKN